MLKLLKEKLRRILRSPVLAGIAGPADAPHWRPRHRISKIKPRVARCEADNVVEATNRVAEAADRAMANVNEEYLEQRAQEAVGEDRYAGKR